MEMGACVPATAIRPARSRSAAGDLVVRLGVPLLDEYLGFLAGRCRPNTVLAVAYGFLLARGDVAVNPVPRGLPTRRERQRPGYPASVSLAGG